MNTLQNFGLFGNAFLAVLLIGSISTATMANPVIKNEEKTDKTILKTREAVSNASPDDWFTLAKSAERCIKKGVNLTEACQWLDKSLEIREASYNLSIKGDYYVANRLPEKALECYVKSIEAGKKENPDFDLIEIQKKISAIVFK